MNQNKFDLMIGRLDRILSEMMGVAKIEPSVLDTENMQTMKHHAEDMILAGQAILKILGFKDKVSSPVPEPCEIAVRNRKRIPGSDVSRIDPGIYFIKWKSGGGSVAVVGHDSKGRRFYQPTNFSGYSTVWGEVDWVELITTQEEELAKRGLK